MLYSSLAQLEHARLLRQNIIEIIELPFDKIHEYSHFSHKEFSDSAEIGESIALINNVEKRRLTEYD